MDALFCRITEKSEWLLSQWWGFVFYCLLMAAAYTVSWDHLDRFVYVSNGVIVVLLLNSNRRDAIAIHKKLDDLVPDEHMGIEKSTEKELEKV